MAEKKITRLGQAAKEFNVSTATIVDFLTKRDFVVEDSANFKLSEEMVDLLTVSFQREKNIKEEAKKIEIGIAQKTVIAEEKAKEKAARKAREEQERALKAKKKAEEAQRIKAEKAAKKLEQEQEKERQRQEQIQIQNNQPVNETMAEKTEIVSTPEQPPVEVENKPQIEPTPLPAPAEETATQKEETAISPIAEQIQEIVTEKVAVETVAVSETPATEIPVAEVEQIPESEIKPQILENETVEPQNISEEGADKEPILEEKGSKKKKKPKTLEDILTPIPVISKPKVLGVVDLKGYKSRQERKAEQLAKEEEQKRLAAEEEERKAKQTAEEAEKQAQREALEEEKKRRRKEKEREKKRKKKEREKEQKRLIALGLAPEKTTQTTVATSEKRPSDGIPRRAPEKEYELLKTDVPQLKAPTILGKVDLTAVHVPKKKTYAERRKEIDERIRDLEGEKQNPRHYPSKKWNNQNGDRPRNNDGSPYKKKPKKDDKGEFIPTHVDKLAGVKVVDKIQLDDKSNSGEKQKRKRIILRPNAPDRNSKDKDRRDGDRSHSQDNNNRRPYERRQDGQHPQGRDAQGRDRFAPRTDRIVPDVNERIKRTTAKMAPAGKTKSSKHRKDKRENIQHTLAQKQSEMEQQRKVLNVTEFITVNEIANMMDVPVNKIIATCMGIGLFVSINQRLERDNIELLASEFGFEVDFSDRELEAEEPMVDDNPEDYIPRAPIVTVMGHVDHGKTSLLDYIRNTSVTDKEAGGITQHIGAYEVTLKRSGRKITFLDTPGHAAFTAMRARGAKVTDIVIVVIAADDQIMPQTIEAINHAQAAGVPMIFAINKIDKPGADPEKIRAELSNKMNILTEEWGGKVQSQDISAKKGTNVDILLEKVLIEAEMLELKANPTLPATGTVIESSLDKGRGYVATMLVQNGTLKKGDIVVAGTTYGKIRAMYNQHNETVTTAGPSVPALVLGLDSAPQAGDTFRVYADEKEAKSIASKRQQLIREQGLRTQKHITLDEIGRRIAIGDFKEINLIIKADVDGSVEALADSLLRRSTDEVQVNVIHKSIGQVTETDVMLASASNAIIIAFNVRPTGNAKKMAEHEQVDIRIYSIIYDAINDLKDAIKGMKAPEIKEVIVCNLEVREVFKITKVGAVAGCYVLDGKIQRTTRVRVIRDGIVTFTGRLGSLKRFKDDVKEVTAGFECGLNIESYNDIKIGDIIEGFEEVEVKS